jgi:hypothetical protein
MLFKLPPTVRNVNVYESLNIAVIKSKIELFFKKSSTLSSVKMLSQDYRTDMDKKWDGNVVVKWAI